MSDSTELEPRLRISRSGRHLFGPGKADLLRHIAATGSLAEAAKQLDMSYQRAWSLMRELNGDFREPLVVVARGGTSGGGATLTPTGEAALAAYERMQATGLRAMQADWAALQRLLK